MLSSIFFVNPKGEVLIYRIYRDDITRQETLDFCANIIARKSQHESPIVTFGGATFLHITVRDITLVASTKSNINTIMAIQFLQGLVLLCRAYFGGEFDENLIRKHFTLIYELLDEAMDYGVPQILDPDLLKMFIFEGGVKANKSDLNKLRQITTLATGPVSWRDENAFYKKNEVFIDVVESVNVILSNKGTILRTDVHGQVNVKCQLSGMPECKFGMNDKLSQKDTKKETTMDRGIVIDDMKFHQCVRLNEFDKQRAITFIPPDGSFELMNYRISENVNLPFKLVPVITEPTKNKIEVNLKLKALFEKDTFATNVVVKLPCPKNTASTNIVVGIGRAKYEPENGAIMWRIKKFQGESESLLRGEITLSDSVNERHWSRPPISLDFQVPMFTASGLRVRFLKISEKSGYKPVKWIKYVTKAGDYHHRI